MKCPKCGEEMAEGALYCEHCGEDIHIVPDFEPELEQNIQQIISGIMEELEDPPQEGREGKAAEEKKTLKPDAPESRRDLKPETAEGRKTQKPEAAKKKRRKWPVFAILAALLLGIGAGAGVWLFLNSSLNYQIGKAEQCVASGAYDKAVRYYERALELDEDNIELQFGLAEVYFLKNNKIEYEYLLREIAGNEKATLEQLDRAYGKLIAIYRARGDYDTINQLILGSNNEQMISIYQNYIANPPEFSVMEGYYTNIQPLKLTAMGSGKIYYTLDGTEPDENSIPYTMPIILEKGRYVVKAVFVNDNGICSDVVSKEYFIDNDDIPAPEISVVSGEYYAPVSIEVMDLDEDEEIYYTTDGTTPTYSSNRYTGPIPMPIGTSRFMFAKIVDGVTGEVAERNYVLTLNTDITPAMAVDRVKQYARETGRILDDGGHFDDSGAIYIYEFLYAVNINDADYYMLAEVRRDPDGSQMRTGSFFAVDIYDGTLYRQQYDEGGRSVLTAIDEETEMPAQ